VGVLKARVSANPEELADRLLDSAAGAVTAARVLEKTGFFEPKPESVDVPPAFNFQHMLRFWVESRIEAAFLGFELTDEQRAKVLGAEGEGGDPETSESRLLRRHVPDTSGVGGLSPESPSLGSHPPQKNTHPENDFQARQIAEYRRQREELGLAPNDGNNDRPSRGPRFIEPDHWEI
jgi:hypothetical protein